MFGRGARRRTPTVLQLEAAECGAASLAMVLGAHGRFVPLEELRALCGVSRDGAKASSILKAARTFGLSAKGLKAEPEHLRDLKGPMIAFVNFNHFLVVEGVRGGRVYLNDPATGRRSESIDEFAQGFTGVVLTFEAGETFERGDTRPPILPSLLRRMRGFGVPLLFAFFVSLCLVVPGILVPFFSQVYIDYVVVRALDDWLLPLLIGIGLTALARFVLMQMQGMALLRLGEAMTLRNGHDLFRHLLRLPVTFFEQRFSGEVADRLRLSEALVSLLTGQLVGALLNLLMAAFFLLVMISYHAQLAAAVAALAMLNVLVLAVSTRVLSERYHKISIENGKLMGAQVGGIKNIETFKASGAEDMLYARWNGLLSNLMNEEQAAARVSSWVGPLPGLISVLISVLVLVGGGYAVTRGDLSLGELVAMQSLAASFAGPVAGLAGFGAELQQIRSYTQRLDDVLQSEADQSFAPTRPKHTSEVPQGHLRLADVSFGYNPLDPPLLRGIDLDLRPGARIALVGASGSGKSTLGKLITGIATPRSGQVEISGRPHADWTREAMAARLAYVRQDVVLFRGTITENLTLWDDTIPEADVIAAAHDAQIHETISSRPGGYDAEIADGGRNFSGGERQRLEIARALATNPSIIVLDEATSALDAVTEHKVLEAIRRRGTTSIIIAHRLSAIRDCDAIILLDRGQIAEQGRHEDLLAQQQTYARLIEA